MTTIYTGVDIVEVARVERLLQRFPTQFQLKVFTKSEIDAANGDAERLAVRFAAKEASKKILTAGWHYLPWRSIEVIRKIGYAPQINLQGKAALRARQLNISSMSVSLSHSGGMAIASVVAVAE